MKAAGNDRTGRLMVRQAWGLVLLCASATLLRADDGATAVADPPPAAEAKPAAWIVSGSTCGRRHDA